ncbi:hypothetical protein AYI82_06270 [Shewanella algae]|uniref:hypothetical protein n=1 Tax=Shewanella algae TaxID=38313 RepID=UPI0011839691|nr:hypothetical protein [Shewanella algae]TVL10620.1 hypothetical protein AYI82_06270 [Shewanella algae]
MNNQENKPHQLSLTIQTGIQGKAPKYCGLILENPHRNTFQIGGSFRSIVEQVIPKFIVEPGTPKAQTPVFLPYSLKPVDKLLVAPKPTIPGTTEYKRSRAHDKYHFLVLDFDGTGDDDKEITPAAFHQLLKAKGWSHWLYTTTSHDPVQGINRFRVLIPMKEGLNFTSIRDRKKTLKRYFDQMVKQAGYASTLDRSSFSENQGFHLPQQGSQNLLYDGSPLDLMRFGKDPAVASLPDTAKGWSEDGESFYKAQRQATVARWRLEPGKRDEQLHGLALNLVRHHGRPAEVTKALETVIRSSVAEKDKRQEHLNKVTSKVQAAVRWISSKTGFAPVPAQQFQRNFTPLEDVEQAMIDALNSNYSILLNVTPGAGKTRTVIKWAADQVQNQNKIIGYAVKSCSDADEVAEKFKANGVIDVRVIQPRMPSNCANFAIYEAKRKGDEIDRKGLGSAEQERGATIYCKSCPVGKAGRCEYSNQTAGLSSNKGTALIYKHAHLFDHKVGIKDQGFGKLDVLIVDEELLSTYANDIKDAMSLEQLSNQIPEGETLWRALFDEDVQSGRDLHHLLHVGRHRATANLVKDRLKQSGIQMLRHLGHCIDDGRGSNSFAVDNGGWLKYVGKPDFAPSLNPDCRLVFLDGTGDVELLRAITGRSDLVEKRVDVDLDPAAVEVVQVINDGFTFSKSFYNARQGLREVVSRWCSDGKIFEMTNKDNTSEGIYLYNQRGKNDLEQVDALAVTITPQVPYDEIEAIARSIYRYDAKPISMERETVLEVGRGVWSRKQQFVDERVRRINDQLTGGEILQAIHRARPIRRTAANQLKLYIFSNEVLDITVTKTVGLAELGLVIPNGKSKLLDRVISDDDLKRLQDSTFEGVEQVAEVKPVDVDKATKVIEVAEPEKVSSNYHDQKAKDALTRFVDAIKKAIQDNGGEPLKWKRSVIEKASGITAQTWRSQAEKVDELLEQGLEVVEVAGRQKDRKHQIVRLVDVAA